MEEQTEFEALVQPIDIIVTMVFKREMQNEVEVIFENYKESATINTSSQEDIDNCVKNGIRRCFSLLSKKYIKKKVNQVFTKDGLIYYLYMSLYTLVLGELEEKINTLPNIRR